MESFPELSPEDLVASRPAFIKTFQSLFPFSSLHFYFPERPQSALTWKEGDGLEELGDLDWDKRKEIFYQPRRKRLFLPLTLQGKQTAILVLFGVPSPPGPKEKEFLLRLGNLSLELAYQKKQSQLDPSTSLLHEFAFRRFLIQALKDRAKTRAESGPEKLSLAGRKTRQAPILGFMALTPIQGERGFSSLLATAEHQPWLRIIKKWFPPGTTLAAIYHHPLTIGFFIAPAEDRQPLPFAPALIPNPIDPAFTYHLGWAIPDSPDLETAQGIPSRYPALNRWWEKAWSSLQLASQMGGDAALGFDEIPHKAGRVIELLPGHRAVINLGQKVGLKPYMRFSILTDADRHQEKGLALPLEILEHNTIMEIFRFHQGAEPIQLMDSLRLIAPHHQAGPEAEGRPVSAGSSFSAFQKFQHIFREAIPLWERFTLLIGKLDDSGDRLELWGEGGLLEILKEIIQVLQQEIPSQGVLEAYGQDGFILFLPDWDRDQTRAWITGPVQNRLPKSFSLSFGLADYPCASFQKIEILDNVLKTLDHLSFLGPRSLIAFDALTLNISGDRLYNQGDPKGALTEYEKALELDPGNINVLNSLGVCHADLNALDRARDCFQKVLALAPDDFMASFNLGFALVRLGKTEQAIHFWEEAAERLRANFDLSFHLGRLYRDRGEWTRALTWFKKAEENPDRKGYIFRSLAEVHESLGQGKEAMAYYKKALKVQPQDALALSQLGSLYLERGESLGVALSLCLQATRIDPQKGGYWFNLGKAYFQNHFHREAIHSFNQALTGGENSREIYKLLGLSYSQTGKIKEAKSSFREALKRNPEDEELRLLLQDSEAG
jgi:tetratricopeptide (TPR) repeat protein